MSDNTLNCWEALQCGREPGGVNTDELGVCPAAEAGEYDGVNEGLNAGRFCWVVAGTLCHGEIMGTFAQKALNCMKCEFYGQVVQERRAEGLILNPSQLD